MRSLTAENKKKLIPKILIPVLLLLIPLIFSGSEYLLLVCCIMQIYIIAVSGLDVLFGYCGQISLGHAAFYAIGAYTSGIMHNFLGLPMFTTIVIGAVIGAAIGALLAYPASKLVFHFLSLATIAFGEIVYQILCHSPNKITGNFNGLFSQRLTLFGMELDTYTKFYYFGLICVAVFLLVKVLLIKSRTGRAFMAIRENTHAAAGMGINVRKYKVLAFTTSAFFTAFAGGLYMHLVGYVHPSMYTQTQSVLFLTMMLFGGSGSIIGPIIGVCTLEVVIELLRVFENYMAFIYGILLLIVVVLLPGGLYGGIKDLYGRIKRKIAQKNDTGKWNKEVKNDVNG